jgi:hypothetical protein
VLARFTVRPLIVLAATALALGWPGAAVAQADTPTLGNETVFGLNTFQVEPGSTCQADGSGTINFAASGTASGPFSGTLTTTGSVTLGPTPPPQGAITFRSPVTAVNATFTITSGATTITGTETLGEPGDTQPFGTFDLINVGECLGAPFTTNQFGVGMRYSATIDSPEGTFSDNGFGHAFGAENRFISPNNLLELEFASLSGKTEPGPPTNVIAAAGDGSAAVSWLAPDSNGGTPIRRYMVTASPGGQATAVQGTSATVSGLTNGVAHTFTVTATNAVGEGPVSAASNEVTPQGGNPTPEIVVGTASTTAPTTIATGGGAGGAGASITVPAGTAGGLVSMTQTGLTEPAPTGYSLIGQQVDITAPDATADNPLVLVFRIDQSVLDAAGVDEATVQLFRDGVAIGPCDSGAPGASPDPCVAERTVPFPGGAEITVRSSHASVWNVGKRLPFTRSGFFEPVDALPILNTVVKAGSAIPVKFSLNGDWGLGIFADRYPRSAQIPCTSTVGVDAIEQTLTAGQSSLSYDPTTDRYTYVWKTDKSWSVAPGGPCRQLVLRLADGSFMRANFKFLK